MSDTNNGITQAQLESEIEKEIQEKSARITWLAVGAVFIAWAVASIVTAILGIELTLQFSATALTPIVVFVGLRVTYINTFERNYRLKQSQRVAKYRK